MSRPRRAVTLGFVVILGLFLLGELVARVVAWQSGDEAAKERRAAAEKARKAESDATLPLRPGEFHLHPYFGYVFTPRSGPANNQGFPSGGVDYPYVRKPGEFVIGLFGGTLAQQVMASRSQLSKRLQPELEKLGYRQVTVLAWAVGGWREPQPFNAMVSALSSVDLVLLLDGFNEINLIKDDDLRQHPASFPWDDAWMPLAHPNDAEDLLRRGELIAVSREAADWTTRFDGALGWSRLSHLVWRSRMEDYTRRIAELRGKLTAFRKSDWSGYETSRSPQELKRNRDRYFDDWADLIRFAELMCRHKQKPFFHFIQPNQHFAGAKPLSDEEKATIAAKSDGITYDYVTGFYKRAEAMTATLAKEGFSSSFLGYLYKDDKRTLYAGPCCMLNPQGVEVAINAIADRILASGKLHRAAP
jgi:hypothetical protein